MPFVKGQSGNPKGRPKKGSAISEFLRHQASMPADENERRTKAEMLAEALFRYALAGDVAAAKVILDRIDGPVANVVTGADGGPVSIEVLREAIRDAYPDR